MSKKKNQTISEKLLNKEPIDQINVFMQVIILFLLLIFIISSLFVQEVSGVVKMLLSLTLLIMGYNNMVIFKRKGFSILYFIIGIYFMIVAVLEAYGL